MVEDAGRRMALEILPGAVVGGIDGFLRLCEHIGSDTLGLNFDTGHAWACKENLYLIPAKLGERILGTHLCDNFGGENLSLRPGAGSIDWPRLIAALQAVRLRRSLGHRDRLPAAIGRGRVWKSPEVHRGSGSLTPLNAPSCNGGGHQPVNFLCGRGFQPRSSRLESPAPAPDMIRGSPRTGAAPTGY